MSTYTTERHFVNGNDEDLDESDAFCVIGYPQTPTTMISPMDKRRHLPAPHNPAIEADAPATISGVVSTRSRTKKAPPDSDRSLPEALSNNPGQKDVNPLTAPSGRSRNSEGNTRIKKQKQQRRKQDVLGSNKKQPLTDEVQLSPKSRPVDKRKSRGRKQNTTANSIPTPPETIIQHEDSRDDLDEDDDTAVIPSKTDEDILAKDPKQRKTLERNRAAARKCGIRKRNDESTLSSREQAAEDQNRYLSGAYNSLVAEVYFLKTELLRHTDCNCKLIQEYVSNEARRTVERMSRSFSDPQVLFSEESPSAASDETRHISHMGTTPNIFDYHNVHPAHAVDSSSMQYNGRFVAPASNNVFQPSWDSPGDFQMNSLGSAADELIETDGSWQFGTKQMVDSADMDMPDHDNPRHQNTSWTNIPVHNELLDPHYRNLNNGDRLYGAYAPGTSY
jgi:hypothetical protein